MGQIVAKGIRKPEIIRQIGEVKSLMIGPARFPVSCLLRRDIISITSTRIRHQRHYEKDIYTHIYICIYMGKKAGKDQA